MACGLRRDHELPSCKLGANFSVKLCEIPLQLGGLKAHKSTCEGIAIQRYEGFATG